MRPLYLKMSAFGPYAGAEEIAMEKLGDRGLYLITGDTGAGKTTIFDAICFALYGEPSGMNRDTGMFRSKYASADTTTEVELVFTHGNKEYSVRRIPEYMRPSKRGEGYTRQVAEAELHTPDGRVITRIKDVNSAIEEIMGINREQFSQIVMLSQGEFLKLLLSETKDRIGIFRKLFRTGCYQSLQYRLEDERKAVYGLVEDARKSIDQFIAGIQADDEDVLSIEVKKAKAGEMTCEDVILLLDKLTASDQAKKAEADGKLESITAELEKVNAKIGAAESLQKAKESLKAANDELQKKEPAGAGIQAAYDKAKKGLAKKAELEKEAVKIEGELPDYDRGDRLSKEIKDTADDIEKKKMMLEASQKKWEEKQRDLEEKKKEQAGIMDSSAKVERLNTELVRIKGEKEALDELSDKVDTYFARSREYKSAVEKYKTRDEEFIRINTRYEKDEQLFRDGQAGILAEGLRDGEKCPVCGSLTHPEPAARLEDVPTEAELKEESKKASAAREEREKAAKKAEGLLQVKEAMASEIKEKAARLLDIAEGDDIRKTLEEGLRDKGSKIKEITGDMEKCRKDAERKALLDEEIPGQEKSIKEAADGMDELKREIAVLNTAKEGKEAQLKEILEGLGYDSRKAASEKMTELSDRAASIQKGYERAEAALKEHGELIASLKAKIESLKETIASSDAGDITGELEQREELIKRQKEYIEAGKRIATRLNVNESIRTDLIRRSGDIEESEKRLQWVKALSDTANGKLSGKEKIMLETYVQMTFFDRIIERANIRFLRMSSGQYELIRLKEAENARSQSGLDLGVRDHNNGSERSVRSLSGGESFMASLSLALGLSDEIQSSAGGIQIDTLFVDEGFGSLDPGALDQAYAALAGLSEGNKLVGIISHVADLKDRIDRQIVIKKHSGVSTAELLI